MNLERLAALLSSGIKPANAASIMGVSPGRISQLLKDSVELQNLISEKEAEIAKQDVEEITLTAKYHTVEHMLLNQILDMAPTSELRDVTSALRIVAERQEKMKQRLNPVVQGNLTINHSVVQIALPTHALPQISYNEQNEVVAINDKTLAPLSSQGVTSLFEQLKNKGASHEQARLPSASTEGSGETLSEKARNFLDSLDPAPFAAQY
jgi:hypothetical protein